MLSNLRALAALSLLAAGLLATGCKAKPELSASSAQTLIQGEYDKRTPEPALIAVDEMGLKQGLASGLWKLTKVYPNQRWADYTLTDTGKKSVKLQNGGDVIQWRPGEGSKDFHFFMAPAVANKLKAKEVGDPQDDVVPGVDPAKTTRFTEAYDWTGIPDPVSTIAHNAINKPSVKRVAEFALVNNAWTLHDIK